MSIAVTSQIDTVGGAWELLLALGSGTGLVLILRWYWWRINAWSEISAMLTSFVVSVTALKVVKARPGMTEAANATTTQLRRARPVR